jgi:ATP-binding cassette, subfamily B, bacterial
MNTIEGLSWPLARLGEGLALLVQRAGLLPDGAGAQPAHHPRALALPEDVQHKALPMLARWLDWAANSLGVQAEAVSTSVPDVAQLLRDGGPAVLHFHDPQLGRRFVLLLAGGGAKAGHRSLRVLGPDLRLHTSPIEPLRAALCRPFEAPLAPEIDRLLQAAQVPPTRCDKVRALLLAQRLAHVQVDGCWIVRVAPTSPFWQQLRQARLPQRVGWILALFAALYTLEIGAWRLIGQATLDGRFDAAWLTAWALMLLSLLPLRALSAWLDASFVLDAGRILKQRLLAGALRMDLDSVRQMGSGQLLGRVMESQALEGLALSGGLGCLVSLLELGFAAWILASGAAPVLHLTLLVTWLLLTGVLTRRYFVRLRDWTLQRLDISNDLIERMVGHRTSLAQAQPARRDAADDARMQAYLQSSQRMDQAITPVVALAPGGWIWLALAGLAPAFVAGSASPAALAISLGGILFAHRALGGISGGLASLSRAALAWQRVAPLFQAGAQAPASVPFVSDALFKPSAQQQPLRDSESESESQSQSQSGTSVGNNNNNNSDGSTTSRTGSSAPLLDASRLSYRYRSEGEPVLHGVDLRIQAGDRLLLQGPSGGGKSTLMALLAGLRQPAGGLLLLGGLDRATLGDQWHRWVTAAPQFHENHILTGTLAFNLLLGRHGSTRDGDLQEAQTLCEALGLGDLLARMPAGLMQRVGETGWQLSHGERSRIFLARALLQNAPLTILDESFGALDPETLRRCLACAWQRANTLLVVAHP